MKTYCKADFLYKVRLKVFMKQNPLEKILIKNIHVISSTWLKVMEPVYSSKEKTNLPFQKQNELNTQARAQI